MATAEKLFRFGADGERKEFAFRPPEKFTALAVSADHIYFGTENAGLLAVDRKVFQSKAYRVADGLLFDQITALKVIDDKLWIGFGHGIVQTGGSWGFQKIFGGAGYLEIASGKFIGFPSTEPSDDRGVYSFIKQGDESPEAAQYATQKPGPGDSMPPSRPVPGRGVRRYEPAANRWSTFKVSPNQITCVEAAGADLFVGEADQSAPLKGRSLWVRRDGDAKFKFFSVNEGLPHDDVYSLLSDGGTLWVGGYGYVAAFDPAASKFTRILSLPDCAVVKMFRLNQRLWIVTQNALFSEAL
jgi:hypothetical protein